MIINCFGEGRKIVALTLMHSVSAFKTELFENTLFEIWKNFQFRLNPNSVFYIFLNGRWEVFHRYLEINHWKKFLVMEDWSTKIAIEKNANTFWDIPKGRSSESIFGYDTRHEKFECFLKEFLCYIITFHHSWSYK